MPTATRTEWTFQGDVTHWFKSLCEQPNSVFKDFDQDERLPVGQRPDGVLYGRLGEAFCEFELKRPHVPAEDPTLLLDAANKALQLGARYIVTWNVNELICWTPDFGKRPLYWDKWRRKIASIRDLSQYTLLKPALQAAAQELFRHLSALYTAKKPEVLFPPVPLDERFVDFVHSHVDAFAFSFAEAMKMMENNRPFMRRLRDWFSEQQLPYVQDDFRFIQAGRILAHLLINRVIFYEIVRQAHPGKLPVLKIPDDLKGDAIRTMLKQRFAHVVRDINYEPVFEAGFLDDVPFPETLTPHLQAFVDEVAQFDYSRIPHDVVGRVYERIIPQDERHLFGQFFTRSDVVDLIVGFCVRKPDDVVMDGSCGAGTFLVRSHSRLRFLDPKISHAQLLRQLYGADIAKVPAHLATINLIAQDVKSPHNYPRILHMDFFDASPLRTKFELPEGNASEPIPKLNAFVGNPPYTRQEEMEDIAEVKETYKQKLTRALANDFGECGGKPNVTVSKRAGIHAYFFLHGTAFLQDGGRIGLVTSNSWLDVDYGKDLQRFFLERFKIIAIIEPPERWFPDAAVNTCVTILEKVTEPISQRANHLVKFVRLKDKLENILPPEADDKRWRRVDELVQKIESLNVGAEFHPRPRRSAGQSQRPTDVYEDATMRVLVKRQSELWEEGCDEGGNYVGAKWGKYLRAPDVYFRLLQRAKDKLVPLSQVADVRRGFTTGANEWFYVTDDEAKERGIPARYLKPVIKSPRECDGIIVEASQLKHKVVLCHDSRKSLSGTKMLDYIRWGESQGFHKRPTCASREQWWDLAAWKPANVLWQIITPQKFRCLLNVHRAYVNDDFAEIEARPRGTNESLCATMNSTVFYLFAECQGRQYGGGSGPLKTNIYEVARLPVLDIWKLTPIQCRKLLSAFKALCRRDIKPIFDEVKMPDRQRLDDVVLEAMGFANRAERLKVRQELYEAVCKLVHERLYRAQTVQRQASSRAKANVERIVQELLLADFPAQERKAFPKDFVPAGTDGTPIELPEGEVRLQTDLFGNKVIFSERELEFGSPLQARFVAIAATCGERKVTLPTDEGVLREALAAYDRYVRTMEKQVDASVHSGALGRARQAVKTELMKRLHLVKL